MQLKTATEMEVGLKVEAGQLNEVNLDGEGSTDNCDTLAQGLHEPHVQTQSSRLNRGLGFRV